MWVFDGEEWTQEGEEEKRAPAPEVPEEEMLLPQLQLIEIVQTTRKTRP